MAKDATLMAHSSVRKLLKRIGLEEKEIEVYLALLAMKIGRATDIAKTAKQSRSHTYIILRDLKKKGLVSEIERGKIIHFVAEPPERLLSYLKNREQELEGLQTLVEGALPFLSSLTPPLTGQPRVTVMHGLEGIKHVYRDVLTRPFVSFFNPQIDWEAFGGNIVHMLFGKDAILRGKDLLVNNDAAKIYLQEVPPHEEYEVRLLPKGVDFDVDVIIFEHEVSIFTFSDEATVIRIENPALADAMRTWHGVMWEMSKEVCT
ncbi:hypothetical protein COU76_00965 [Candidatus Peregrinibacteria bacterium CG10_big_fil_rev_8_21_14_0_10_49_10]|nr:MAG: hypothetical protein COU76_00965 [Candidatus Peregrinibacteria bacterium CG10_big_fil_rev_8_21_14_0_10_49_10]